MNAENRKPGNRRKRGNRFTSRRGSPKPKPDFHPQIADTLRKMETTLPYLREHGFPPVTREFLQMVAGVGLCQHDVIKALLSRAPAEQKEFDYQQIMTAVTEEAANRGIQGAPANPNYPLAPLGSMAVPAKSSAATGAPAVKS